MRRGRKAAGVGKLLRAVQRQIRLSTLALHRSTVQNVQIAIGELVPVVPVQRDQFLKKHKLVENA